MAAEMAKQSGFNKKVFDCWIGAWTALSKGEGDESEGRRFKRRQELQLLMMTPAEMKIMSAYQWQNMSLGGLKPHELRGLAYHLSKASAVRRAAAQLRLEAAPLCAAGCTPMCRRLQPRVWPIERQLPPAAQAQPLTLSRSRWPRRSSRTSRPSWASSLPRASSANSSRCRRGP